MAFKLVIIRSRYIALAVWLLITVWGVCSATAAPTAGKAIRFDKNSAELVVARTAVLEPEEMTVEGWARIDGPQDEHSQLVRKLVSWEQPGFLLAVSQSGYECVQFRWRADAFNTLADNVLNTWYRGQWHHYAAIHARDDVSLLVDGVVVNKMAMPEGGPLRHNSDAPLRIGAEGFCGEMDELRIWSRALPVAEIKSRMYRTLTGKEDGLVAYWQFDETDGVDRSANHLRFERDPDLSGRLVDSGVPISPAARKKHRAQMAKISKGRGDVEKIAGRLPPLNASIYRFATSLAGEPFGSGDCWNFVNRAIDFAGARRRDVYVFGEPVTLERAITGDLIHFKDFSSPSFGSNEHSGILWRNHGGGKITVVHQNGPPNGKNVGLWEIDVRASQGTIEFYRPEK